MKTTILSLVLASIAGLISGGEESLAGTQEPDDKELRALLEARRDTLKKAIAMMGQRLESTQRVSARTQNFSAPEVNRAHAALLEAELALAKSQHGRIAIFEKMLETQACLEAILEAQVTVGLGDASQIAVFKAARMKAEIDLYNEKNGEWPASGHSRAKTPDEGQRPDDDELPASREARRDTLQEAVRLIRQKVEVGLATSGDLASQNLLVLAAELEMAKSPRERIAIYEKVVENQKEIERILRLDLEVVGGSRKESLNATAARINVEIQLYQARKGKWPVITESGLENPAVTQEPEDKELQTLLETRRDTLRKVVQLIEVEVATGTASVIDLTNANTEFLKADLALAKSQDERIAIFEKLLESPTELERVVRGIVKDGRVPRKDLLAVTAARMKAEIDLHKARKKVK